MTATATVQPAYKGYRGPRMLPRVTVTANSDLADPKVRGLLVAYATCMGLRGEDLEDAVQEAWLKAWASKQAKTNVVINPWLYRILANVVVDRLRASRKRHQDISLDAPRGEDGNLALEEAMAQGAHLDPEEHAMGRLEVEELGRAVERLPEPYRETVRLLATGIRYQDIEVLMGTTEGTVKSRVHRARGLLKRYMATGMMGGPEQ